MGTRRIGRPASLRLGQAAELCGVSIETLRRWGADGTIHIERSGRRQPGVTIAEVSRLLEERRRSTVQVPIASQSARNRFQGVISSIERDGVAAVVEVIAGPYTLVSMITARAVIEHGMKVGDEAVCAVKATDVMVEIRSAKQP